MNKKHTFWTSLVVAVVLIVVIIAAVVLVATSRIDWTDGLKNGPDGPKHSPATVETGSVDLKIQAQLKSMPLGKDEPVTL